MSSFQSFFYEKDEFFSNLDLLLKSNDAKEMQKIVERQIDVINIYQEQPHLLDPHIDAIVVPLMARVREIIRTWYRSQQNLFFGVTDEKAAPAFSEQVFVSPVLHRLMQLVYSLCKTRGYKTVIKRFPHEVADLEPVVQALVCQDRLSYDTWEIRYVLLLWLSILVLMPFDLNTIDSAHMDATVNGERANSKRGLIWNIISLCKGYLIDPGVTRDGASVCLAKLLTRPDMEKTYLQQYIQWSLAVLSYCSGRPDRYIFEPESDIVVLSKELPMHRTKIHDEQETSPHREEETASTRSDASELSDASDISEVGTATPVESWDSYVSRLFPEGSIPPVSAHIFLATGVLQSIAQLAKFGQRETIVEMFSSVTDQIMDILNTDPPATASGTESKLVPALSSDLNSPFTALGAAAVVDGATASGTNGSGAGTAQGADESRPAVGVSTPGIAGFRTRLQASPLLRKLKAKIAGRIGLANLPPRVASWRYQRGQRSLLDNLLQANVAGSQAEKERQISEGVYSSTVDGAGTAPTSPTGAEYGSIGLYRKPAETNKDNSATAASTIAAQTGLLNAQSKIEQSRSEPNEDEDDDSELLDIPSQVDEAIDTLLTLFQDSDTIVRWAAAKGIGRITARLPYSFASEVVEAVLSILHSETSDAAWHGGCMTLAELARRGLLPPSRLPEIVPLVEKALLFEQRRGRFSVGIHVRDAACYVCWALARSFAPKDMAPYVLPLARKLLLTACFDREVNCRRAASAAFQENVGRQGADNFPHGIDILTVADYFTLGNRHAAYCHVAPVIASYPEYRDSIRTHLLDVKLLHWDPAIRELSAEALTVITKLEPQWTLDVAIPKLLPLTTHADVGYRQGALLGLAKITLALAKCQVTLPTALRDEIRNVVVLGERNRVYTGRGGDAIRIAMCKLLHSQCLADHPLTLRAALRFFQSFEGSLIHPYETVQAQAALGIRALAYHSFAAAGADTQESVLKQLLDKAQHENPSVRRGAALALGALPRVMYTRDSGDGTLEADDASMTPLSRTIQTLVTLSQPEQQLIRRDTETRRNSVMSMADLVQTVGVGTRHTVHFPNLSSAASATATSDAPSVECLASPLASFAPYTSGLTPAQLEHLWNAVLLASHDYAVDNRGDVGSWVRKTVLESLEILLLQIHSTHFVESQINEELSNLASALSSDATFALDHLTTTASTPSQDLAPLLQLCASLERLSLFLTHPSLAVAGTNLDAFDLRSLQSLSGYGLISGYAAGTRLFSHTSTELRLQAADAPVTNNGIPVGASVSTAYGIGCVSAIRAEGELVDVSIPEPLVPGNTEQGVDSIPIDSSPLSSLGQFAKRTTYTIPVASVVPLPPGLATFAFLTAAVQGFQSHQSLHSPLPATTTSVTLPECLQFLVQHSWLRHGLPLPATSAAYFQRLFPASEAAPTPCSPPVVPYPLSGKLITESIQVFLRLGSEKLDLLRAVAGDALSRILHPPLPLASQLPMVSSLQLLRAVFPNQRDFHITSMKTQKKESTALTTHTQGQHYLWELTSLPGASLYSGNAFSSAFACIVRKAASVPSLLTARTIATAPPSNSTELQELLQRLREQCLPVDYDLGTNEEDRDHDEDQIAVEETTTSHTDSHANAANSSLGPASQASHTSQGPMGSGSAETGVLEHIQWAIPSHSFPRLVTLLGHPVYTSSLVLGLSISVGGLSESVTRTATSSLIQWSKSALAKQMNYSPIPGGTLETTQITLVPGTYSVDQLGISPMDAILEVGSSCLLLLQPRLRFPWELPTVPSDTNDSAGASSASGVQNYASGNFDPSLNRWFLEVLGVSLKGKKYTPQVTSSASSGNSESTDEKMKRVNVTHKIDARVVTPALSTLFTLLDTGLFSVLDINDFSFAEELLALVTRRAGMAKENIGRVVEGGKVLVAGLQFPEPMKQRFSLALLNLLGHPFPKVRRDLAEALYIALLARGESLLPMQSPDEFLRTLSQGSWDTDLRTAVALRDSLYPFLSLTPPEDRMGLSKEDEDLAEGTLGGDGLDGMGPGGAATDFDCYGHLARESGY